jgi:hypothetical protein
VSAFVVAFILWNASIKRTATTAAVTGSSSVLPLCHPELFSVAGADISCTGPADVLSSIPSARLSGCLAVEGSSHEASER